MPRNSRVYLHQSTGCLYPTSHFPQGNQWISVNAHLNLQESEEYSYKSHMASKHELLKWPTSKIRRSAYTSMLSGKRLIDNSTTWLLQQNLCLFCSNTVQIWINVLCECHHHTDINEISSATVCFSAFKKQTMSRWKNQVQFFKGKLFLETGKSIATSYIPPK